MHFFPQTVFEKNKLQQTKNTTSTQMTKIGLYVSNMTDKLISPGKYLTAEEYHKRRLEAVSPHLFETVSVKQSIMKVFGIFNECSGCSKSDFNSQLQNVCLIFTFCNLSDMGEACVCSFMILVFLMTLETLWFLKY